MSGIAKIALAVVLMVPSAPNEFHFAPVYIYAEARGMERSGAVRVHDQIGFDVLYCVEAEKNAAIITCVVHTPNDRLVLVDVRATGFAL